MKKTKIEGFLTHLARGALDARSTLDTATDFAAQPLGLADRQFELTVHLPGLIRAVQQGA